jgi:hypothetical protein
MSHHEISPEVAAEAAGKQAAAEQAAEAAALVWRRLSAGRWQDLPLEALAEQVILLGSVGPGAGTADLQPGISRIGSRVFAGSLTLMGELVWECDHYHIYQSEARECAISEARYRQAEAEHYRQEREVG